MSCILIFLSYIPIGGVLGERSARLNHMRQGIVARVVRNLEETNFRLCIVLFQPQTPDRLQLSLDYLLNYLSCR
jgi:hypothetical protein